jgi:glycosyltransferase involved in cell wall biosynthesis
MHNITPSAKPLISVVMPTYNHGRYIREAIASVLAQTYENLELIIVDNHSTDETSKYVDAFNDGRIQYVKYENNGIIAASRNYGVLLSHGDLIAFIDSDDVWLEQKLEAQLEHISAPGVACVSTDFIPIGERQHCKKHLSFSANELFKEYSYEQVALGNPVMTSSAMINRSSFDETGGFDENPDYRFIEDWELWLRISRLGAVRVMARPLIKYRVATSKGRDSGNVSMRTLKIFDEHKRRGYLDEVAHSGVYGNCCVNIGGACLKAGDRQGIKYYKIGLLKSRGFKNKMRSVAGLALYMLPGRLRNMAFAAYYRQCDAD